MRQWSILRRAAALRRDEQGTVDAMTYILIVTLVGIGMICGLTTIRDQVTQAFGDTADALATVNQTYTVTMTFATIGGGTVVQTFGYVDPPPPPPVPGQAPQGMLICAPATSE
uniref:Flp family type IVb pilin n=1 Tax=Schlesneria paludicola TaxID=360056 RepID=A0A7C4LIW6_9PLAN